MRSHTVRGANIAVAGLLLVLGVESGHAGELQGRVVGATVDHPAVVWIEGVPGEAPAGDTTINHVAGRFEPHVSIGFVGNSYVFRNDDKTLHNTHLYLGLAHQKTVSQRPLHYGATLYNVALPKAGMEVKKPITAYHRYRDDTGFIQVVCNPHPEERAYVLVFDHPYATVTGKGGRFSIPKVPAGTHDVRIWHEGVISKRSGIAVGESGAAEVVLTLEPAAAEPEP